MAIKGAKTVAEYAIMQWMMDQHFDMEYFTLSMSGNKGIIKDRTNDTLSVVYNPGTKKVSADY